MAWKENYILNGGNDQGLKKYIKLTFFYIGYELKGV